MFGCPWCSSDQLTQRRETGWGDYKWTELFDDLLFEQSNKKMAVELSVVSVGAVLLLVLLLLALSGVFDQKSRAEKDDKERKSSGSMNQ